MKKIESYETYFCLVSKPLITNVTPIFHQGFKPKQIVIIVSKRDFEHANNLSLILNKHHIKNQLLVLGDSLDFIAVKHRIETHLNNYHDNSMVLNLSGGTKPITIAAYEVFKQKELPIFYVDQESDYVHFLPQQHNEILVSFELEDKIKIDDYLLTHGIQTINDGNPHLSISNVRQNLSELLVKKIKQYQQLLKKLNYYASKAHNSLNVNVNDEDLKDNHFFYFIKMFIDIGFCSLENELLKFPDEASRFYCNGGWFEEYVFILLRSMKQELKVQDLRLGLKVKLPEGSENELDIIFLANNKLYIVECKTKKFKGRDSGHNGSEVIYKLDTLMSYAGVETKGLLVSYQDLTTTDIQRAKDYDIMIVADDDLVNLKKSIFDWVVG